MEKEIWKNINDKYLVSSLGRIKSVNLNKGSIKILKFGIRLDDYYVVNISNYKHKKNWKVHQLVAQFFIENPYNLPSINHKNGIKTDNRVINLEWCTQSYNLKHAFQTGLRKPVKNYGLKNGFSKLILDINTGIFYYSLNEISELYNYKRSTLGAMLSGQNPNRSSFIYV